MVHDLRNTLLKANVQAALNFYMNELQSVIANNGEGYNGNSSYKCSYDFKTNNKRSEVCNN